MGGNAIGGCRAGMLVVIPGTGGMATAGGIGGGIPLNIGGGNKGAVLISPGELVPPVGGS